MRRKHTHSALLFAALLYLSCFAHASEGEAAQYVEQCKTAISYSGPVDPNPRVALDIGFCFGLMDGLRGANSLLKKADPSLAFCEPATFNNADLAKTFVAGVATNPELRGLRGALAAQVALRAAYPCKKGK